MTSSKRTTGSLVVLACSALSVCTSVLAADTAAPGAAKAAPAAKAPAAAKAQAPADLPNLPPAAASDATKAPGTDLVKAPEAPKRTPVPLFVPAEYPMPGAPAPGTYAMRCWQKGRLLFTEANLTEAVVSAIPNKVAAFTDKGARVDAANATLYVVEVANSLCVIKRS